MFLRQNTSQVIRFGPFLDITDGVTEETGLTLANTDIRLSKDGGAFAAKNSGGATHDSDGWYSATLDGTDTATVGELVINVHQPANTLPVWLRYWVLEEAVYDALYGAGAEGPLQGTTPGNKLDVNATGETALDLDNTSGTLAAAQIAADAVTKLRSVKSGTATSGTTTTLVDTVNLTEADTNYWKGCWLLITSGSAIGQVRLITGFSTVFDEVTFVPALTQAITTNTYEILPAGAVDLQLWKGSTVSGSDNGRIQTSVNEMQADVLTAAALATDAVDEIVDGVWDELLTGGTHGVADSAGRRLRDLQEFGVYEGGAVWIDTINGTAGTTDYESGTAFNPVNTIADANTIAASLGLSRFRVAPGSSITFVAAQENQSFEGHEWTLALGGQSIAGTEIQGATISGTGTGAGYVFMACSIGAVTLADGEIRGCGLAGTFTASAAADYYFDGCFSQIAGAGSWTFDFGAAVVNTNLNLRHHSGGVTINNKDNTGTDMLSVEGHGQLVVAASSSGAISLRGGWDVTNTGGATITYDDLSQNAIDILPILNTPLDDIPVFMALSSDHVSASTGLTLGVTRSIDGGAFAAGTGTAAEIGDGMYQYDASTADMNGTMIVFRFTGTASDDTFVVVRTGG